VKDRGLPDIATVVTDPRGVKKPRIAVAAAAVVVFLGVVTTAQLTEKKEPAPSASAGSDLAFVRRDHGDPMAIGAVDAPVVLVEWTDMRCPFCAVFTRDTLPVLIREYVDTGKVRLEVHDVAYFGEQSETAAVAARAAGLQGRFFDFLSTVYDAAPEKGHPELPRVKLVDFARKAGVPDVDRFTADLDDASLRAAARGSNAMAQRLGVTSVPFFVAGDTALSGAQPLPVFRGFLDSALAKAR
jgi:protein-disulfide isomerase